MIMGQPFGVVMTGIGVIANAGVIVNNNIVLIDTYDRLRREGVAAYEAIMETCRERARPVVLTAVTAILGVLPIAFGMNVEFLHRELTIGAPATQWWISLSTAIVFGLGFATILTLIVTPAALMAIANMAERRQRLVRAARRAARRAAAGGNAGRVRFVARFGRARPRLYPARCETACSICLERAGRGGRFSLPVWFPVSFRDKWRPVLRSEYTATLGSR